MERIEGKSFDAERVFYGSRGIEVSNCRFAGPADGESAFKESSDVTVRRCFFNLRYPFWHDHGVRISDSELTPLCRAALWYSDGIFIENSRLHGIKALRECADVEMIGCHVISPEFGWSSRFVTMKNTDVESEYFMMRAEGLTFANVSLKGKYSFQYIQNATFENCSFQTKDAFWHAHNVKVKNSVIDGEYLGWYSDGLTLVGCKIRGTQPFCYCKNLTLVDCEMLDTDLCFEKSQVTATVTTPVVSIKNPRAGVIYVPSVGKLIFDDPEAKGKVFAAK